MITYYEYAKALLESNQEERRRQGDEDRRGGA
jgi:hypothetical protein